MSVLKFRKSVKYRNEIIKLFKGPSPPASTQYNRIIGTASKL